MTLTCFISWIPYSGIYRTMRHHTPGLRKRLKDCSRRGTDAVADHPADTPGEADFDAARSRFQQQAAKEKLSDSWGVTKASALWRATLSRVSLDVSGLSMLDFGSSWGYFGRYLLE